MSRCTNPALALGMLAIAATSCGTPLPLLPNQGTQKPEENKYPPRVPPKIVAGWDRGLFRPLPDGWDYFEVEDGDREDWTFVWLYGQDGKPLPEVWVVRPNSGIDPAEYEPVPEDLKKSIFWFTSKNESETGFPEHMQLGGLVDIHRGLAPATPRYWIEKLPDRSR